jgi:hypothetical protein
MLRRAHTTKSIRIDLSFSNCGAQNPADSATTWNTSSFPRRRESIRHSRAGGNPSA